MSLDQWQQSLDALILEIQSSIDLIESGDAGSGVATLASQLDQLDELSQSCTLLTECDQAIIIASYQDIISAQQRLYSTATPMFEGDETDPLRTDGSQMHDSDFESTAVASTDTIANAQTHRIILTERVLSQQQVLESINNWLTWNRPHLVSTYENYLFLRNQMLPPFDKYRIPESLLFAILATESGGRVHSYSGAGAAGPMQFMRATASRYGLAGTDGFDDRLNPALAADAAARYLIDQYAALDDSLEKTLAAYNSGENRLRRLQKRTRKADFWSSEFYYSLPRDTRRYVPDVLAAAWLFDNAAEYKLDWPDHPHEPVRLSLQYDASLGELAVCLGNRSLENGWFRTLRNLNPAIKAGDRIDAGTTINVNSLIAQLYQSECIIDEAIRNIGEAVHIAAYEGKPDLLPYRIRRGDTLSTIARRYRCVSMKELASMNNIAPPRYSLRAGKTIKVPNC